MAKRAAQIIIGIDTSKDALDCFHSDTGQCEHIDNTPTAIAAWLGQLPAGVAIAIEATNTYHECLLEQAMAKGHTVYLIDAKQLHHYRLAIGRRAKTDTHDAKLLARYLAHEQAQLKPLQPLNAAHRRLWRLLKRRAALVQARQQLQQACLAGDALDTQVRDCLNHLQRLSRHIEQTVYRQARQLGLNDAITAAQSIPGIGPLSAVLLALTLHRGTFNRADAFVAFLGLDVRVTDSGRYRGKRKLTKRGDPEARRVLFNAARAAVNSHPPFKRFYHNLLERGYASTAAYVATARKLVRIAFALMRKHQCFDPNFA